MSEKVLGIIIWLLVIFGIFSVLLFIPDLLCPEVDFYELHKEECEQCHLQGKAYALCSGFCYPNNEENINTCSFPLSKNCNEVPHGSNLGTRHCIWQLR